MKLSQKFVTAAATTGLVVAGLGVAPPASDAASALPCRAHMDKTHPADYSTVHVLVKTAAGATVHAEAHYKTTDTGHTRKADGHGHASVPFYISGATPGYLVRVTVTVSKSGHHRTCRTSFRPHS